MKTIEELQSELAKAVLAVSEGWARVEVEAEPEDYVRAWTEKKRIEAEIAKTLGPKVALLMSALRYKN